MHVFERIEKNFVKVSFFLKADWLYRRYSRFNYFDTRQQAADSTSSTEPILLPL